MIDFSKWENLWNVYNRGGNTVPGTPASGYMGWGFLFTAIGLIGIVMAVIFSSKKRVAAAFVVVLVLGVGLMFASECVPSRFAHTSEPPALNEQVARTWGLDDLDGCRKTKMNGLSDLVNGRGLPDSELSDGNWKCVAYRDGRRFDATVHVKGHKLGLYTPDGKTLKPTGKDK